ncbi:MAG: hypothetical protein IKJ81_00410 [Bacteroidales bacterium]|nr:hypothetical protein [Bacteroidales bacterium]
MSWLIIVIIFGIIGFQTKWFINTIRGVHGLKEIFPENVNSQMKLFKSDINEQFHIYCIDKKNKSDVWNSIIDSINQYLSKNKGRVSDFALVKDIVDRNVDAAEDEVRELLPVPLYAGLVGTMLGIIIGLLYLVGSEGLETLLSSEIENLSNVGVGGLLQDVAYAMIGSLFGVAFTTYSTLAIRKAKRGIERKKHIFLSWIQSELLPVMNDSTGAVMLQLSQELTQFVTQFRSNAINMSNTIDKVNIATQNQVRLLEAVEQLKTKRVTESALELYERLSKCSEEIGTLAEMLENSTTYLEQVRLLNEKLDGSERRMKTLEDMGEYFMRERTNVERMEKISNEALNSAQNAIDMSGNSIIQKVAELDDNLAKALLKQQQLLESKSSEMSRVITEINNLSGVRQLLDNLVKVTQQQNKILQDNANRPTGLPSAKKQVLPVWIMAVLAFTCIIVSLAVIYFLLVSFNIL